MIPLGLFISTSLYEIVTLPLYWRIIYVLMTKKEFSTPFYKFIWIIGISEMAGYIADVLYLRLPMVSLTADLFDKSPSRWISLALFIIYFFNYPVYFLQIAVSFNRFTALWMPIKHKELWDRWWRRIVLASFILSFCFTAHRLPFNATSKLFPFVPSKPELGYIPSIITYDYYGLDTNLVSFIFDIIILLVCIIVNAGSLIKIIKYKRSGNLTAFKKAECRLLVVSSWMCCTLVAMIFYQAISLIIRNNLLNLSTEEEQYAIHTVYVHQSWADDFMTLSHPWVLIAVCESIRNAALPFLRNISKSNITIVSNYKVIHATKVEPNNVDIKTCQIRQ